MCAEDRNWAVPSGIRQPVVMPGVGCPGDRGGEGARTVGVMRWTVTGSRRHGRRL